MQTAESYLRDHPTTVHGADSAARHFLAQPEMRAVLVVVVGAFAEKAFQVPFIEHDHMVQQIAPKALRPALGDSILPGPSE